MADTLRIFCRQAAFDAHKLYYVPQFDQSEQRLTDGKFSFTIRKEITKNMHLLES